MHSYEGTSVSYSRRLRSNRDLEDQDVQLICLGLEQRDFFERTLHGSCQSSPKDWIGNATSTKSLPIKVARALPGSNSLQVGRPFSCDKPIAQLAIIVRRERVRDVPLHDAKP